MWRTQQQSNRNIKQPPELEDAQVVVDINDCNRPCGLRRVITPARLHTLLGMFRSVVNHAL